MEYGPFKTPIEANVMGACNVVVVMTRCLQKCFLEMYEGLLEALLQTIELCHVIGTREYPFP